MFRGAELSARNGGLHTEDRRMEKESTRQGHKEGTTPFLIFEKVLRVFQDIQHGIEIEIPIPFGPLGPSNKLKSRSHGEWREERRGG